MGQFKDKELLHRISQRLKALREEKSVSQEQVYNETEIHIARIETGKVNISVSTLSALCAYFKVSLSEFFLGMKENIKK